MVSQSQVSLGPSTSQRESYKNLVGTQEGSGASKSKQSVRGQQKLRKIVTNAKVSEQQPQSNIEAVRTEVNLDPNLPRFGPVGILIAQDAKENEAQQDQVLLKQE